MPRIAKKDTFMYEVVGPDVLRRAQVFAGQFVPDSYIAGDDTDSGAFDEFPDDPAYGAVAPSEYKHTVVARIAGIDTPEAHPNEGNAEQESVSRQARRGRAAHAAAEKKAAAAKEDDEE
jgi:hypothetical protein